MVVRSESVFFIGTWLILLLFVENAYCADEVILNTNMLKCVNNLSRLNIIQVKLAYTYDRLETVNGTGEYFNYALDISKKEDSDTVFMVQADIEQLIDLDDDWKV